MFTRDALKRIVSCDLQEISVASVGVNAGTLLSAQTAKAFGDELSDLDRARNELATIVTAGDLLDRVGLRLDVMELRGRVRS